jgi:hypothetical protein
MWENHIALMTADTRRQLATIVGNTVISLLCAGPEIKEKGKDSSSCPRNDQRH